MKQKNKTLNEKNATSFGFFRKKFVTLQPNMSGLDALKVDLIQMVNDVETRQFHLTDDFFTAVEATEVERGDLDVTMTVSRAGDSFSVSYRFNGTLVLPCDLCLSDMTLPVCGENSIVVRIGNEDSDDGDIVTVNEREGILDMAWYVYESIALSIPIKHVHETGKCNDAMTKLLQAHQVSQDGEVSAARSSDEGEPAMDPRWSALLNLKKE